ncbi:MAG: NUDIX domain-containing protein [Verrucomicrobia bacterium]|nr:NUDIX domain-containing protein [Verrucomicrobiota bacterium]
MNYSAGLLMYRQREGALEVLLAHPGGPFFTEKDDGAWTIPKGLVKRDEDKLAAAQREFTEETGFKIQPPFLELGSLKQNSGKTVHAWAFAGDADPAAVVSNTFEIEWPPRSGQMQEFPEVDRVAWFPLAVAHLRIHLAQRPFLRTLEEKLRASA